MPIPVGDRPFDRLAAELVADQCTASPTLGSVLGLTEYDEALPDLSADGIAATQRVEDAWVDAAGRPRRQRADRRRADRPRPRPDGPARPGPDARLGRLAAQPRPLRGRRPHLGVRAAHHPAAAGARAGGRGRRAAAGHAGPARARGGQPRPDPGAPGPAAAGPGPDRRRCGLRPVGRRRVRRPGRRRPGARGRRAGRGGVRALRRARRGAGRQGHRRLGHRRAALRRAAAARPRASATAPGSCARRARRPTTTWPPT